jgi:hypothetical protein
MVPVGGASRGCPGNWPRLCCVNTLFGIILVLHLLGWAIVLGGTVTNLKTPRIAMGVLHGVLTALVTGILMVGLLSSGAVGDEEDVNNVKFAVKLLVALAVTGLVVFGNNRPEKVTRGLVGGIAGLVVVNVAVAVLWQ